MAVTYTDRQYLKLQAVGDCASLPLTDVIKAVGAQNSDFFNFSKAAADGSAAATTAETDLNVYFPRAVLIRAVQFTPQGSSVVADPTNNATITVSKRDATGGNLTTVATLVTTAAGLGTATLAQRATAAFALSAANVRVAAGSTLTFSIAKGGTGVVIPISMLQVEAEWD